MINDSPEKALQEIGDRIANLRKQYTTEDGRKLTQESLAKKTGYSRTIIAKIENGVQAPDPIQLYRFAHLFSVSIDYLVTGVKTENTRLNEETGLSDKAIEQLTWYNKGALDKNDEVHGYCCDTLNMINSLLSSEQGQTVLSNLIDYVFFPGQIFSYTSGEVVEYGDDEMVKYHTRPGVSPSELLIVPRKPITDYSFLSDEKFGPGEEFVKQFRFITSTEIKSALLYELERSIEKFAEEAKLIWDKELKTVGKSTCQESTEKYDLHTRRSL